MIVIELEGERYGVGLDETLGVARLTSLSPLPGAPRGAVGTSMWRGEVVPVLDLTVLAGGERQGLDDRSWLLVVDDGRGRSVGLLAGQLLGLEAVPLSSIRRPAGERSGPVVGVTPDAIQIVAPTELMTPFAGGGQA